MLWLCNILNNFVGQWKDLLDEVENRPLEYFVFLAVLLIGMGAIYFDVAGKSFTIFIVGWTTAFFVYKRAKAVEQQLQATEKSRANERFDRLCAMLGENGEPVQIGGLIGLDNLAREQKESYKKDVFGVICAFIREGEKNVDPPKPIQYAIDIFFKVQENDNGEYFYEKMQANLASANLKEIDLEGVQLPNAVLDDANLSGAKFSLKSNFQGSSLQKSHILGVKEIRGNFTECKFQGAILINSYFVEGAILDSANFSCANIGSSNLLDAQSMDRTIVPLDAYDAVERKHKSIKKTEDTS